MRENIAAIPIETCPKKQRPNIANGLLELASYGGPEEIDLRLEPFGYVDKLASVAGKRSDRVCARYLIDESSRTRGLVVARQAIMYSRETKDASVRALEEDDSIGEGIVISTIGLPPDSLTADDVNDIFPEIEHSKTHLMVIQGFPQERRNFFSKFIGNFGVKNQPVDQIGEGLTSDPIYTIISHNKIKRGPQVYPGTFRRPVV